MIVVIDCNVVISAGLSDGLPRRVIEHVLDAHRPAVSPALLDEYRGVAQRPKFAARAGAIAGLIERIAQAAHVVESSAGMAHALPDVDDEAHVAAAVAARADCVVTGNLKHFPDRPYGDVEVLSVRGFATLAGVE